MTAVILFVIFWIIFCSVFMSALFLGEKWKESGWDADGIDPLDPSSSTDLI